MTPVAAVAASVAADTQLGTAEKQADAVLLAVLTMLQVDCNCCYS
jgi:hypothetical protein